MTKESSLVVFASGRGSNFEAICRAVRERRLLAKIGALIVNVSDCPAVEVAGRYSIPVFQIPSKGLARAQHEAEILKVLSTLKFDWIVLAGYMKLLSDDFVSRYSIVNIHPSLLPAFPGTKAYRKALLYGVKQTGVTVHLVDGGVDEGPIVAQKALPVFDNDTEESLTARGLMLEHELYVETLGKLLTGSWFIETGTEEGGRPRVVFRESSADLKQGGFPL